MTKKYTTIAFVTPWGYLTSADSLKSKLHGTPNGDGIWENIKGIGDPYEADWVIGWETLNPELDFDRIDMSKVILIGREPPWMLALGDGPKFDNWNSFPEVKHKFKCALGNSHLFASWTSRISYQQMKDYKWRPRKRKLCVVMSNKSFTHGQAARLDFVKRFCKKYPGELDIYGKGMASWCSRHGLESHYKGSSEFCRDNSKHDWISRYQYSLSFENGVLDGYFSEKINDVFMAFAKPIFWGAEDIGSYFPKRSHEYLDILRADAPDKLYDIIQNPITEEDVKAIAEARRLVMDVWSEWPCIKRIIEDGRVYPEGWTK